MAKRKDIHKGLIAGSGHITVGMAMLWAFLLYASLASSECVEVIPVPSSRNVRITAHVNGKPLQGAEVEVFQTGVSFYTDDQGVAMLPPLKPGFYSIVAASGEDLVASLYLHVMENSESKVSVFLMDLQPTAKAQMLATAAKMPVSERVQEFKGVAEDPSGAGVPGALIEVYPRDSEAKSKRIQLKAGENGHFSAPLADGT